MKNKCQGKMKDLDIYFWEDKKRKASSNPSRDQQSFPNEKKKMIKSSSESFPYKIQMQLETSKISL